MSDLQDDEKYKSSIKSLAAFTAKVAKLYLRPDAAQDNIMNYQATLIELYPVIKNLALELNTFYGARLEISDVEFDSPVEKIDALMPLLSSVRNEFKSNKAFADCRPIFNFDSPQFSAEITNTLSWFNSLSREDEPNKAMYWFYNNIQAIDSYFNYLYDRESEKLWETLSETELGEVLASYDQKQQGANFDDDDLANTFLNSIYDVGIKYMDAKYYHKELDIPSAIIEELKNYNVTIKDVAFKETLRRQLPGIIDIYSRHENGFHQLETINDALDNIDDLIWDYDDEEIYNYITNNEELLSPQLNVSNIEDVILTQKDVDRFVNQYEDYKILREETIREFNEYLKNKPAFDKYMITDIEDKGLNKLLTMQLKSWLFELSRENKKVIPPLADLAAGRPRFGVKEEYARFINETLNLALDIIVAGRAAAIYLPIPDNNGEPVHIELNNSDIGENYIYRLIDTPKKMTVKDFQTLSILINSFEYNYNHYRPMLGFDRREVVIMRNFDDNVYLQKISSAPDCIAKMNIADISERIYHTGATLVLKELEEQRAIFTKDINNMNISERESLRDYIAEGKEIYPDLDAGKVLHAVDNIVTPLVLMPIYEHHDYSEKNFRLGMEYMVASSRLPQSQQNFIKSAADGYRKMLVNKHLAVSAEGQNSRLHYMAKNYSSLLKKHNHLDDMRLKMQEIHAVQRELFEKSLRMDEYETTQHPGKNYVTALLLNSKINKR